MFVKTSKNIWMKETIVKFGCDRITNTWLELRSTKYVGMPEDSRQDFCWRITPIVLALLHAIHFLGSAQGAAQSTQSTRLLLVQ